MIILVTTDGSSRSLSVLPHAAAAARSCAGTLILLRVFDPGKASASARASTQPRRRATGDAITSLRAELSSTLEAFSLDGEARVEVLHSGERTHDAVVRVADELDADVIAMASRGAGSLRRALLGSVAVRVINESRVPVMVAGGTVKRAVTKRRYSILLCVEDIGALAGTTGALAPFLDAGAGISLLHLYVPTLGDRDAKTEVASASEQLTIAAADALPARPTRLLVERLSDFTHVEEAVLRIASATNASAVAVVSKRLRPGWHGLVTASITERLVDRSPLPVIVVGRQASQATSPS